MDFSHTPYDEEGSTWRPIPARYGSFLTRRQAELWSLVLDSRSIPCCVKAIGSDWQLLVPEAHFDSACNELHLYEEKNRDWPPRLPPSRSLIENTLPTVSVLILLATFQIGRASCRERV